MKKEKIIFWAMILVALSLWYWGLRANDFFEDGTSNEFVFSRASLQDIFFNIPWNDQSPLYFVILKVWRVLLGETVLTLKLFPYTFSLLMMIWTYRITKLIYKNQTVALAALALSLFSYIPLWAIIFGRMYPLLIWLTLIAAESAVKFTRKSKPRYLYRIAILMSCCIYIHLFAFWFAGIIYLYILVWLLKSQGIPTAGKFDEKWRGFFMACFWVFLASIPQFLRLWTIVSLEPLLAGRDSLPPQGQDFLWAIFKFMYMGDYENVRIGSLPFGFIYSSILLTLCAIGFLKSDLDQKIFIFIWVFVSLAVFWRLGQFYDLRHRYFLYLWPILNMVIANGSFSNKPIWKLR